MHKKTSQFLTLNEACSVLRISRSGLYRLIDSDKSFPRPVKTGTARQARAYIPEDELAAWQQKQMDARGAA
ncbi:helix-turn-helix transcriptional regulator [Microbulbifer sp. ARAS458-1]|uniref:helix-turn-helix transcriptional regulator n=1 Tax=Microbulbifer sp. ARAS458-1 TaxID=3140242 RepID=UPI0038782955